MRIAMETNWTEGFVSNWLWLCPLLGIIVATWVLIAYGLSFGTSLLAALLLACPALMIWGGAKLLRGARARSNSR
jgi:hypothetical protein